MKWLRYLWLIVGVFACSTAVIFIKESTVHPVLLSGYRLIFAAVLLLPVFLQRLRRHRGAYTAGHLLKSLIPAAFLATHFITWTIGARLTGAANASLLVNLVPLVTPFLLVAMVGESVNRRELGGTVLAMGGVVMMTRGDLLLDPQYFQGDLWCLGSMVLFAAYLVLGRRNRHFPDLWLYLVPLYAMAGLLCFAAGLVVTSVTEVYPAREYLWLLALAVIPTITGHSLLNASMKLLRGQVVSVVNLAQFIFAGVMAYFIFQEVPGPVFYAATALIVAGSVIAILATPSAQTLPTEAP